MKYFLNDGKGYVDLYQYMGNDNMAVNLARLTTKGGVNTDAEYWDTPEEYEKSVEKDDKLRSYLLEHKHTTPFEFASVIFLAKIPNFVLGHLVRHRAGVSMSVESSRYRVIHDEFYIPEFRLQDKKNRQGSYGIHPNNDELRERTEKQFKAVYSFYQHLIDSGVARETARPLLPQSIYVSLAVKFNLTSLTHFLRLRLPSNAQKETRLLAWAFLDISFSLFPKTMTLFLDNLNFDPTVTLSSTDLHFVSDALLKRYVK